jgi:hypothetical protein
VTAHVVAEPTLHDGHNAGSCEDCAPQTCDICGNHVGAEAHAWADGWRCPDCCPRCELVGLLGVYRDTTTWGNRMGELADVIADGALTDDEVASVMGVEG